MLVATPLLPIVALVLLDLAVAWGFGDLQAATGGFSPGGVLAVTSINSAATWLFLASFAYLIAQAVFAAPQLGIRVAGAFLFFIGILMFLSYLGFAWGFIAFNGFSPSWDAIWFLTRNIVLVPHHLLQSTFILSLLMVALLLVLAFMALLSMRRLARMGSRRRGRRYAFAGIGIGLALALTSASATTANISAVGFTRLTMHKALRVGLSYARTSDPAALFKRKQRYQVSDSAEVQARPVIVILVEALRRDLLLMEPSPAPFLASLKEQAVWFDKAYATASHSNYADLAFWYSQYPLRHLDFFWRGFPRNAPWRGESLFSAAKKHGFTTAYVSSQDERWGEMINWLDVEGEVDFFFHAPDFESHRWFNPSLRPEAVDSGIITAGKLEDSATLRVALDWIRSLGGDRRFVLGMNLQNTHFSYVVPPDGATPYRPSDLSTAAVYYNWPETEKHKIKNRYLNAVWNLDRIIADFAEALKKEGIWEDCVFLVVGDSGEAFYEHGFGNHSGPMYDEVMRTLALMKLPDASRLQSGVYGPALSHIDFAPTILEFLGIEVPDSFQGRSLLGEPPRLRLFMHTNAAVKQHGVVEWPWKLLHTYYPYERLELYQLESDPAERRNLLRAESQRAEDLRRLLDSWVAQQLLYYGDSATSRLYAPPRALDMAPLPAGSE